MDTITVIKNNHNDEDVVLVINDDYANMEMCNVVMPVAEVTAPNYTVVKKQPEIKDSEKYHIVNYTL